MAKYKVDLVRREFASLEVEARNHNEAMIKAEREAADKMGSLVGGKFEFYTAYNYTKIKNE